VKKEVRSKTKSRTANRRALPGLTVKEGFTWHPFDLEFGVKTSGLIAGRNLKCGSRADRHNTAYFGVAPSVFREMIARWRRLKPAGAIDEFNFIDLGAGMGRALLLASEFPFRTVIGVELNPTLARMARKNVAQWKASGLASAPVRVKHGDAVEFQFPAGPCVVFMFNPFGAPVMRRLIRSWSRSLVGREGQLDVLYVNNEQELVIRRQSGFVRLFTGKVMRSRTDAIADHKILANQPDGEYAVTNWEDCSIFRWMGKAPS
jgi:SAM-dependent methyltransferase